MTKIVPLSDVAADPPPAALAELRGGAISIGNFDGVHRGHAALLAQVRKSADRIGGPAIAVALDPHPSEILRPDKAPPKLTSIARRAELMDRHGIDALVVCRTGTGLLKLTAEEFFEALIRHSLDAKAMVEGPNFFFGRDRGGDINSLGRMCRSAGIELQIADPLSTDGQMVSSTRIRGVLASGDIAQANDLLGHPYQVAGTVIEGARRGRTFGFPTANLGSIGTVVPGPGVYGGDAFVGDAMTPIRAAIHIGPNPTFDDDAATKVEVHLIDYDGDLYGTNLRVDFLLRVRDIIKFESPGDLVDQLRRDVGVVGDELGR